jgi:hypothetical protein
METLKALYRLMVMGGTLAVVAMAYLAYGPPIDELRPLCQRGIDFATELVADCTAAARPPESQSLTLTPIHPVADLSGATAAAASQSPSTTLAPATPAVAAPATVEPLLAALNRLGMGHHKLHSFGAQGEFYRFSCRVSYPGQSAIEQHFEAIAESPQAAVSRVLEQVVRVRDR